MRVDLQKVFYVAVVVVGCCWVLRELGDSGSFVGFLLPLIILSSQGPLAQSPSKFHVEARAWTGAKAKVNNARVFLSPVDQTTPIDGITIGR